ncbi:hypothetical protein WICPIJ_001645 [Wickerhamomyces pijperi]|uniref:Sulfhydryl oxidase n=1 Tax=Wickerhamomyces pijperi TaxID=599730 RepID=A0A9P8QAJ2_WICPI|nr:hypothetical protein WICPIJ_001645 [Wickerhamomyces pijperi]
MSTEEEKPQQPTASATPPAFGSTGRKLIYGPDGKPCRSCNTLLDFKMATGKPSTAVHSPVKETENPSTKTTVNENNGYSQIDPPDVTELGRSTWTFLHSLAATYPVTASTTQQSEMLQFLTIFSKIYPCWFCAKDFKTYIEKEETKPKVKTQEEFGRWLCEAHNEVNRKVGKKEFDCGLWRERWKDGWDDVEKKSKN